MIDTQISITKVVVAVGDTTTVQFSAANRGQDPVTVNFELSELPENWLVADTLTVKINPGSQQTASLYVTPVRWPPAPAGEYTFLAKIVSSTGVLAAETVHLTVRADHDFNLGPLVPRRQSIFWSSAADYAFEVTNGGNANHMLYLSVTADEPTCRFEFKLPHEPLFLTGQVAASVDAGQSAIANLRVSPIRAIWVGIRGRTHRFTISVSLPQSGRPARFLSGELVQRPLVGPVPLLLLAALLIWGLILMWRAGLPHLPLRAYLPPAAPYVYGVDDAYRSSPLVLDQMSIANAPAESSPALSRPLPVTYEEMFQEIAPQYGLDWPTLEAIAYYESRLNPMALGAAGDMGLMQIIPSTWGQWAPKVNVFDPFDPYSNIQVGAAYLADVRDYCRRRGYTDPRWMLVAYNWGPHRLNRFWNEGGTWQDIPLRQQRYASGIIQMATARAQTSNSFEEFLQTLTSRSP